MGLSLLYTILSAAIVSALVLNLFEHPSFVFCFALFDLSGVVASPESCMLVALTCSSAPFTLSLLDIRTWFVGIPALLW